MSVDVDDEVSVEVDDNVCVEVDDNVCVEVDVDDEVCVEVDDNVCVEVEVDDEVEGVAVIVVVGLVTHVVVGVEVSVGGFNTIGSTQLYRAKPQNPELHVLRQQSPLS